MSKMQVVPAEQVQSTAQILLAFLDSDGANVPGSMIEGVVSGKSILRGLLNGNLVLAQPDTNAKVPEPQPKQEAEASEETE